MKLNTMLSETQKLEQWDIAIDILKNNSISKEGRIISSYRIIIPLIAQNVRQMLNK